MTIKQTLREGDERHPIWRILNIAVVLAFVLGVKYLQQEPIDTEFISWLLGTLGVFEISKAFVNRKVNQ